MQSVLARKLRSARARVFQQLDRWARSSAERRQRSAFAEWMNHLQSNPPQVLLGANFAEYGGVRQHIHAIEKYSSADVELAPPDRVLQLVSPHDLRTKFREGFFEFEPSGIATLHSHVFPWFIEWCLTRARANTHWVHTYHLQYFPEHSNADLADWQRDINNALVTQARHADTRLSVSKWQQEHLEDAYGITSEYLPNGVDVESCDKADSERFVRGTGLKDFVLYVGRNDPVKNPADFVRLAAKMPSLQFVMLGRELSESLLKSEYNVDVPRNLAIRGEMSHADVQDAIAGCAAVVVTSRREGLPTLVLEAMAHRKSIVVPDEAGCLEAIDSGRYGFVYRGGDLGDLMEKTLAAVSDTSRSALARERILAEYDWRVIIPRLDAIYNA